MVDPVESYAHIYKLFLSPCKICLLYVIQCLQMFWVPKFARNAPRPSWIGSVAGPPKLLPSHGLYAEVGRSTFPQFVCNTIFNVFKYMYTYF